MRRAATLFLSIASVVFVAAGASSAAVDDASRWSQATLYFKPLPVAATNPANPETEAKVELGARLYFDSRLSKNGTVSCDSCHSLATFGVDNEPTSVGDDGERGGRNSPTVLNAAFHVAQFWDGRAQDVEEQAGMPVLNPIEMGIPSEQFLVDRLSSVEGLPTLFARAFPNSTPPLSYANIRYALAAFERTLITPAPFDRYLQGERDAISEEAKQGMELFLELGCGSCHNGMTVGGHIFRKFGLKEPYWVHTRSQHIDEGRAALSGDEEDRYVFKVASLRNVEKTYPYFHDGSVRSLGEAVSIMARLQVGRELDPGEAGSIVAFLDSLTGEIPKPALERLERLGLLE